MGSLRPGITGWLRSASLSVTGEIKAKPAGSGRWVCCNRIAKAKAKLGWEPTTPFSELVHEMVEADYSAARRDSLVKLAGFQAYDYNE